MNPFFNPNQNGMGGMNGIANMLTQKFGNISNIMSAVQQFSHGVNGNPEEIGRDMVASGQLTQEQAEIAANLANTFSKFNPNNFIRSSFGQR